jgi:hypothetical protein
MSEKIAIEFIAEIRQTKNMVDHTFTTALNLPEECAEQASWLLTHQLELIKIVAVIIPKEE